MYYRHKLKYEYPDAPDGHMIVVKKLREVNLDEDYPYLQKSAWFKFTRGVLWVLLQILIFPLLRLTHGLRIYGKENIKNNKELFKNGAITISNHVFLWDYLCVLKAIRPKMSYFPAWKTNLEGSSAGLIRWAGGIPIPTDSYRSMVKFKKAIEEVLESGKWLHFFPEGSMWYFYPDIRPLKKAVFRYAVQYDKPIIPMSISFRPRKGLMRLFGKTPRADLHVGQPLIPDKSLSPKAAEEKLHEAAYKIMQEMNGITPDHPSYVADYKTTNYKKTM